MDNQPPIKRPRGFFIEQLLDSSSNQTGNGEPTNTAEKYVKKIDNNVEHLAKFQYLKTKTTFSINDLPEEPEGLLAGIFQYCMDQAIAEGRERKMEPDHLGCTISSNLLTSDIWIPVRKITEDTINTILNRFLEVAQSKKQEGVTLWGEPFTVNVTTIKRGGLSDKRKLTGGSPKKLAPVHHHIHQQCLIKVNVLKVCEIFIYTLIRSITLMDDIVSFLPCRPH